MIHGMDARKTLKVPYIEGLDRANDIKGFESLLVNAAGDTGAGAGEIGTVNWPEDFPYRPECGFHIGWCRRGIGILYHVKGLDLRAMALEDNGPVWEDSCCEFFISDPKDGTYYNFEMNCIGTLLAAKRKSREDCVHFTEDKLKKIRRFSTLEHKEMEMTDREFSWKLGLFIPFSLMGIVSDDIPTVLNANFYKCGDKTAHIHFLSWSPVGCPSPDFHRPDFFGTLELEPAPCSRRKGVLYPALMLLYFIALGFLCFGHFDNMSDVPTTILGFPADKFVHFCMFLPFPLLAYATFCRRLRNGWRLVLTLTGIFALGCLIGGGIELAQGLTDYRSCDILDFRADAAGLAVGTLASILIHIAGKRNVK